MIAAIAITVGLWFVKNSQLESHLDGNVGVVTKSTEDVDLNTFLSLYEQGTFHKIKLEDLVKLRGFEEVALTGDDVRKSIMGTPIEKAYVIYESYKPPETSLIDLGINLTGETIIEIDYNEGSLLGRVFLEQILPLIFFIFIIILAFRFF